MFVVVHIGPFGTIRARERQSNRRTRLVHGLLLVFRSFKAAYFKSLVSLVLSLVLSSGFHIRIYSESTLIKLYTMFHETGKDNGLGSVRLDPEVQSLMKIVYSMSKQIIDE